MADPRRPVTLDLDPASAEVGDAQRLPVDVPLAHETLHYPLDGGDFFTEPAVIPINYDGGTF